ncbi:hypothetical protein ACOSQ2_005215 [Xanthoceras sorbifolium]
MSGNSLLLVCVLVLLVVHITAASGINSKCIERERVGLLKFKRGLVDECGYLSSWGPEADHINKDCCKWRGVRCSNKTGHVVMINLKYKVDQKCPNKPLRGNLTSSLLVLQNLNHLDLSGNDFLGNQIPEFIGSLTELRFLDISMANLSGRVPYQLGNLTNLLSLNMGYNSLYVSKLTWLSHLHKLTHLHLDSFDLSEATDWLHVISGLPSLKELHLGWSTLPTINDPSLSSVNSSTSLAVLDLAFCGLSDSVYDWLFSLTTNFVALDLSSNQLEGPIPDYAFRNMTSVEDLDLSLNQITAISMSFRDMCSLKTLNLYYNNLTAQLPELFLNLSGCTRETLKSLKLGGNNLSGSIPDITQFPSLRELQIFYNRLDGSFPENFGRLSPLSTLNLDRNQLWGSLPDFSVFPLLRRLDISDNQLNGSVSEGLGQLSKLEFLDLFGNSLHGMITEEHMLKLSELKYMDFSFNSLALNFSSDWFPPFHLDYIGLLNCKLGPHFPKWLQSQKTYKFLDISNAGIVDNVPTWFWDLAPNLYFLNASYNRMRGVVPDLSLKSDGHPGIDLSSNDFEGPIPLVPYNLTSLNLSKNKFSGSISSLCRVFDKLFSYLDLSDNLLSGEANNFSRKIPHLRSSGCSIESLNLRNNSFTGEFPSSVKMCKELKIIDVRENKFSGTISSWIGDSLPNLVIVSLRSNWFGGSIPLQLCKLSNIQLLDLSFNDVSGTIPKCLNNLTAMVQNGSSDSTISHIYVYYYSSTLDGFVTKYDDIAILAWKGTDREYKKNLGYIKSIDLSSNNIFGEIPEEITSLVGLISLNLSRNSLTGLITPEIGQLNLLDFLDLSNNQLSGEIPATFSLLNFLGMLDLSNNNLSGKIPSNTKLQSFDASSYIGNTQLCGPPLPNKRQRFYISLALGFIVGFWGFVGSLLVNKSWRCAYLQFLNHMLDSLHKIRPRCCSK